MDTVADILGRKPVHPFPARMAPSVALNALEGASRPLRVLDPMAGSGTVLAVARAAGHRAYGFDLDPLAVLLATVWTSAVDPSVVERKAEDVLERAKRRFASTPLRDAYPRDADDETRSFVRYWFDPYARRQLAALACSVSAVRDAKMRNVLWCAFSRLIITKQAGASLAMDLSHSRPHKTYDTAPVKPFAKFVESARTVAAQCIDVRSRNRGPAVAARLGDARKLPMTDESIDVVICSPPYLNAIDYMRTSKFTLVWMGHRVSELRGVRSRSIGSEVSDHSSSDSVLDRAVDAATTGELSSRQSGMLRRYARDMRRALGEMARVLRTEGRAVLVVGDSTLRGTFVQNSAVVSTLAETVGLRVVDSRSREIPANRRYLPPPCSGTAGDSMKTRMRSEVVISVVKD